MKEAQGEMVSAQYESNYFQNLPKVSKEALKAIVYDIATDPTYSQRLFRFHNNQNNELMSGVVIAANIRAAGDIRRQEDFIKGAEYVLAALQREIDVNGLNASWDVGEVVELRTEVPPNVA